MPGLTFRALENSAIALVRPNEACAVWSLDLTLDPSLQDPRVYLLLGETNTAVDP
jgi:hypothetical protein